jgi:hypothetical protein
MDQITVTGPLKTELDALSAPVELVDEMGRPLGHFVPRLAAPASDDCPYSSGELEQMRREEGGRSLAEIWGALGAK